MKKLIIPLIMILIVSCSKDEQQAKPIEYPIKFAASATPNGYEYVNRVSENTIVTDFYSLQRIGTTANIYNIQASNTVDFTQIKYVKRVDVLNTNPAIINCSFIAAKSTFTFDNVIYFRVIRTEDKQVSEVRSVKVNWN